VKVQEIRCLQSELQTSTLYLTMTLGNHCTTPIFLRLGKQERESSLPPKGLVTNQIRSTDVVWGGKHFRLCSLPCPQTQSWVLFSPSLDKGFPLCSPTLLSC
jgi:hypothetical protein